MMNEDHNKGIESPSTSQYDTVFAPTDSDMDETKRLNSRFISVQVSDEQHETTLGDIVLNTFLSWIIV